MTDNELSGAGQGLTAAKIKPDIQRRIDMPARVNDAWDSGDMAALRVLEGECIALNMTRTAKMIRGQLESLKERK